MVVQHSMEAMNTKRQLKLTTGSLSKSIEKLSSGYQINGASDDASGLAISEKMRYQIRGLNRGYENIQEGKSYCQVADGALGEIQSMLQRINELSVKAANGTLSKTDRIYVNQEIEEIKSEMQRICENTKFNEEKIFQTGDDDIFDKTQPYIIDIVGNTNDLYIYNESYDSTAHTATYGGIAYNGKRYAWDSISPTMYDSNTGLFNAGTYTLKTDDGTTLRLICTSGSEPPQVMRQYGTSAGEEGIYIDGNLVKWEDVRTASGKKFDPDNFTDETYYFRYNGITASFTPEYTDDFNDVVNKLYTKWVSTATVPYEETAVVAKFSSAQASFTDTSQVKDYLSSKSPFTIRADANGIWLEDTSNNAIVTGSENTWASMGISNWGDQSTDIWEDKTYKYSYQSSSTADPLSFEFSLINETSKDSVIEAFDSAILQISNVSVSNHENLKFDNTNNTNVISGTMTYDKTKLSLAEEYGLGRDYSVTSCTFGSTTLWYDATNNVFQVTHSAINPVNGVTTDKTYSNNSIQTDNIINSIKSQINTDMIKYLNIIQARYAAGATNPENLNLANLITTGNLTGGGAVTYLKDVVDLDPNTPNPLISTLAITTSSSYAGAEIDFSGLGYSYQLADLIGTGFNSTCETCNKHYSIEFTTKDLTNTNWSTATVNGKSYNYSYERQGSDYTLYIDLVSMHDNNDDDGVNFTNAVVGIIDAAGYDFHFSQYATYSNDAVLYVFDNRTKYVSNGQSTATNASFSPYSYNFENVAKISIDLKDDSNSNKGIGLYYEYNYADIFSSRNLNKVYTLDNTNGQYVLIGNVYEVYDPTKQAHAVLDRYNLSIEFRSTDFDPNGQDLTTYVDSYIKNKMFTDIADASTMSITSDYAKYSVSAVENDNKAIVTEQGTPYQINKYRYSKSESSAGTLRIQCSSNTKDNIYIQKQKLSLRIMGIDSLNVSSERGATTAIDKVGNAINIVNTMRSKFGAYQNRLEHAYNINQNTSENTQSAESVIRDTDMAKEMVKYYAANILVEAAQSMLTQANQTNQGVLRLLS